MILTDNQIKAPFGIIDMGSNGIRFSIIERLSRNLPVSFEERAPISLLEAQDDKKLISDEIINQVITTFKRFQTICQLEGIMSENIHVVATEATRIASNSKEFIQKIFTATGLKVTILSKEQEAVVSSMGIAGSFYKMEGLTMDLGGGSVEFNYVTSIEERHVDENPRKRIKTSPSPASLPYGAAIMKDKLLACQNQPDKLKQLEKELIDQFKRAKQTTQITTDLNSKDDGYTIYMSGGGFRALGYLSMALGNDTVIETHLDTPLTPSPIMINTKKTATYSYPIPIITGYSMTGDQLKQLVERFKHCDPNELVNELKAFRISKRRTRMIPATCFLVSAMLKVIKVNQVYFSEGGVRQGLCYNMLPFSEQMKDPLINGIEDFIESSKYKLSTKDYQTVLQVIKNVIPADYLTQQHAYQLHRLLPSAILLANMTSHYPKESRASVAFQLPLAGGPLANVTGLLHTERAMLALILAYRQGGEVPDPLFDTTKDMLESEAVAVCKYIGKLMEFIFKISPRSPSIGLIMSGIQFKLLSNQQTMHQLQVILPKKQENPLVEAEAVTCMLNKLNKSLQYKKHKIFSVDIIQE